MLNERGYDWDVLVELQKKNGNGEFVTVNKKKISDKEDMMKGSYKVPGKGTYRIKKSLYCDWSGHKTYRFNITSKEIVVTGAAKVKTVKVTAKSKGGSVVLRWNKIPSAKAYDVYKKAAKGKKFKKMKSVKGTSFVDKKAKAGTKVSYYVAAKKGKRIIKKSNVVTVRVLLPKVKSLKVKKGKKAVTVSWKKMRGVKGYKIYLAPSKAGKFKAYKTVTVNKIKISKKKLRGNKYVKVVAFSKKAVGENSIVKVQ